MNRVEAFKAGRESSKQETQWRHWFFIRWFSIRWLRYAVKDKSCYVTWHTSRVYIIAGYLSDNNHITPALPIVIDARPWVRKHLSVNGSRMTQLNAGKVVFSLVLFLLLFLSGTAPFI